jgi:transcriptional regulator with PAS, ATPase and Fis domain
MRVSPYEAPDHQAMRDHNDSRTEQASLRFDEASRSDAEGNDTSFLIGEHPLLHKVRGLIRRVAVTDATCLVLGESGTGKELAAREIHKHSPRADRPFVAVNCGAIPGELLESEMFGHEKGSFTGAVGTRAGMFQLANGGTIFLDEISEMDPLLQVKLLRVLQDREVRPVGSDRSMKIDVRVIAATNKDLALQVERGLFREDLFYRLEVIPVHLPPLRERRSDVPILIHHFLARQSEKYGREPVRITEEALVHLWEYDWPGNVRELENLVERLVILCDDGTIRTEDLPGNVRSFLSEKKIPKPVLAEDGLDLTGAVEEFENRLIDEALRRTKGNKQAAARLLGLKRTTLVAKLRRRRGPEESDELLEGVVA